MAPATTRAPTGCPLMPQARLSCSHPIRGRIRIRSSQSRVLWDAIAEAPVGQQVPRPFPGWHPTYMQDDTDTGERLHPTEGGRRREKSHNGDRAAYLSASAFQMSLPCPEEGLTWPTTMPAPWPGGKWAPRCLSFPPTSQTSRPLGPALGVGSSSSPSS